MNALHLLAPIEDSVVYLGVWSVVFGSCPLEFMLFELAAVITDISPLSRLCSFRMLMSAFGFRMALNWVAGPPSLLVDAIYCFRKTGEWAFLL